MRWGDRSQTVCGENPSSDADIRMPYTENYFGDYMQPKITNAQRKVSFALSNDYTASLYGDIESPGIIQYHHLLVIHGPDKAPCLFFCSEWSGADPTYKDQPILGVFSEHGHDSYDESVNWLDDALFVLGSFELAREILHLEKLGMAEGEAWAMAEILKRLQRPSDDEELVRHRSGYEAALRKNDESIAEYMKSALSAQPPAAY